jgi:hypothetical protein
VLPVLPLAFGFGLSALGGIPLAAYSLWLAAFLLIFNDLAQLLPFTGPSFLALQPPAPQLLTITPNVKIVACPISFYMFTLIFPHRWYK